MSFGDVEELLAKLGVILSYETVRQWCRKFGPEYARKLRRRQGRLGDVWHMDDVFVKIQGEPHYLWRAIDQEGDAIDILVQRYRNARAAKRFFRKLLKGQECTPKELVTDKLKIYGAARRMVIPIVEHNTARYANNRAEVSHQPTRQQERRMRRFAAAGPAQRFLAVHGVIRDLFNLGRHQLTSTNYRLLRKRSFKEWSAATAAGASWGHPLPMRGSGRNKLTEPAGGNAGGTHGAAAHGSPFKGLSLSGGMCSDPDPGAIS